MRVLAGLGAASALLLQHGTDAPLGNVTMAKEVAKEEETSAGNNEQIPGGPMMGGPKPWQSQLHEEGTLLDPLYAKLTPECRTHYEAMHNGEKEDTANVKMGNKASQEECNKIGGKVCKTQAKLVGTKTTDGLNLDSSFDSNGDGCIPSACVGESDLAPLAEFMLQLANEMTESLNQDMDGSLDVDCSGVGGGKVHVDQTTAAAHAK